MRTKEGVHHARKSPVRQLLSESMLKGKPRSQTNQPYSTFGHIKNQDRLSDAPLFSSYENISDQNRSQIVQQPSGIKDHFKNAPKSRHSYSGNESSRGDFQTKNWHSYSSLENIKLEQRDPHQFASVDNIRHSSVENIPSYHWTQSAGQYSTTGEMKDKHRYLHSPLTQITRGHSKNKARRTQSYRPSSPPKEKRSVFDGSCVPTTSLVKSSSVDDLETWKLDLGAAELLVDIRTGNSLSTACD